MRRSARRAAVVGILAAGALGLLAPSAPAYVFWSDWREGGISRINDDGTDFRPPAQFTKGLGGGGLSVSGDYLYFTRVRFEGPSQEPRGTLGRIRLDGTDLEPELFPRIDSQIYDTAADSRFVYFTHGDHIGRARLDGSDPQPQFASVDSPIAVATDGRRLYVSHAPAGSGFHSEIVSLAMDGGDERVVVPGDGVQQIFGLAVSGSYLYWSSQYDGRVKRMNLAGGAPENDFMVVGGGPTDVAVGPGNVWWADIGDLNQPAITGGVGRPGGIGRADLGGGNPARFHSTNYPYNPISVAVSGPVSTPPPPPGSDPPPPDPDPDDGDRRRPTAAAVLCTRGALPTSDSTCTVTVGDAGAPPPEAPAGTVRWRVIGSEGTLPQGSTCALTPSAYGPGISSCEVVFRPGPRGTPAGTELPVEATYPGSAVHRPTTRRHRLIDAVLINPGTGERGPTPSACRATANRLKGAPAGLRTDNRYRDPTRDTFGRPTGYREGFFAGSARRVAWCVETGGTVVIGGTATAASAIPAVAYEAAWATVFGTVGSVAGTPGTVGGAGFGLYAGWQYGGRWLAGAPVSMADATGRALRDPPDPRFRVLVEPRKVRPLPIRGGRSARARADARLLQEWATRLRRVSALSEAFSATVDKAGGAAQARNATWEGRQMRHAIVLAKRLAAALDALAPVGRRVAARARTAPEAGRRPSSRGFEAARRRIARGDITAAERKLLARLGYTAADIAELRRVARDRRYTTAELLRPPRALIREVAGSELWADAARFFRLWSAHPDVQARAAQR